MRSLSCSIAPWQERATGWFHSLSHNSTIAAVSAEGFLTRLGFSMVSFAVPLYAVSLGMTISEVGFMYALRSATIIFVKPVMGWAADRSGRKRTLVAAVALRCLVGFLFALAMRPWHLYVLGILQGAMTAARDPSASALIAEHGEKKSMASAFAWNTTAREFGRSLGYTAAGFMLQATGSYRLLFVIAGVTSCAALATVTRFVREDRAEECKRTTGAADRSAEPRCRVRYRCLIPYAAFGLMITGTAEMMRGLFPIIAIQYAHLTEGQTGMAASASILAILVAGPVFAWLSDHVNRKVALATRSCANILSSLMYIFIPTFGGFLVARMMDDTGKTAFRPTWGAILAEISDAEPARRARTMSFVDTASTLGEALAPLGAGLLITACGVPVMLGVRVVLAAVTELQAITLFRKDKLSGARPKVLADVRKGEQAVGLHHNH